MTYYRRTQSITFNVVVVSSILMFICHFNTNAQTPLTDTVGQGTDTVKIKKLEKWKSSLMASIGSNGIATFNWSNGTTSNHAFNFNTRFTSAFDNKKRTKFTSETVFSFGYNRGQEKVWVKNMDMFYSQNIFNYSLNETTKNWYLAGILDLSTQIFNGYSYSGNSKIKISSLFSPGFITEGMGILYMNKVLYFGVAPASLNHYFIADRSIEAAFHSVEVDRFHTDIGTLIKAGYYKYFFDNKVYFNTITTLFKDYASPDIFWTANGMARINLTKWLSLNSDFSLLYNDNQNSLEVVTNQSGMPTGISTGSAKLQTYISYGFGVRLKL